MTDNINGRNEKKKKKWLNKMNVVIIIIVEISIYHLSHQILCQNERKRVRKKNSNKKWMGLLIFAS